MADAYKQLVIDFIAKTDKFVTQTTTAANSLDRFGKNANRLATIMTGGLIGGGIILTLQTLQRTVLGLSNEYDALAKNARRVGLEMRDMQTLSLGASMAGMDAEQATKMVDQFSKKIGQMVLGIGGINDVRILDKLGLDAKSLAQLNKIDALGEFFGKLTDISTQSERAAILMGMFGRTGAQAALFAEEYKETLEYSKQFTAQLEGVDFGPMERANDHLAGLMTSLKNYFALALNAILAYNEEVEKARPIWDELFSPIGAGTRGIYVGMADLIGNRKSAMDHTPIEAMPRDTAIDEDLLARAQSRLEALQTPYEKWLQTKKEIDEEFNSGAYGEGGAEKWAAALERAYKEFEKSDEILQQHKKTLEETAKAEEQYKEQIKKSGESLVASLLTPQEKYISQLMEINKLKAEGAISDEMKGRAYDAAQKTLNDLTGVTAYQDEMKALGESYTLANQTPTEQYYTELMKLNQVLTAGTITQDTYARAVANAKNQLSEASGETQRLSELQAWMNANYESTRTPYEKYMGEMQMLNEAMMAGIGSPDLWNRIAMQAEQSLMSAMGNVADAMPGMFGGAPWMQGPLPMNGFGGSSPPGMSMIYPMGGASTPHTPGTAGMATASQIAGVLRGGSAGDTGKQQLAELKRTNTFLERIVYENAAGFRL